MLETGLVGSGSDQSVVLSRYWWILIPLCKVTSLTFIVTTVSSMGAVEQMKGSAWNLEGLTLHMKT